MREEIFQQGRGEVLMMKESGAAKVAQRRMGERMEEGTNVRQKRHDEDASK